LITFWQFVGVTSVAVYTLVWVLIKFAGFIEDRLNNIERHSDDILTELRNANSQLLELTYIRIKLEGQNYNEINN